jgi:hypothetical protein
MIRLILFVIVVFLVVVGVLAVALFRFFGWPGLIAFPFIILALIWLAKLVIVKLVKRFALGLFGMKARALKGATMNVHSIKSVPKPPEPDDEPEDEDDEDEGDEKALEDKSKDEKKGSAKPETPKDYVEVDVTITPGKEARAGVWEPSELMLTSGKIKSLADIEAKEVGTTHSVEIWNGTAFGPDDPGKYPGEQRLKVIFEVKPGTTNAWLHYYNQPIGQLKLPQGTIDV